MIKMEPIYHQFDISLMNIDSVVVSRNQLGFSSGCAMVAPDSPSDLMEMGKFEQNAAQLGLVLISLAFPFWSYPYIQNPFKNTVWSYFSQNSPLLYWGMNILRRKLTNLSLF